MATIRKHHPFQSSLVIGGRRYRYLSYEDTKSAAKARASAHRKSTGDNARVIREVADSGRVHYSIWVRARR